MLARQQKVILEAQANLGMNSDFYTVDTLTEEFLVELEGKTGKTFSREEYSTIYELANICSQRIIDNQIAFKAFVDSLYVAFSIEPASSTICGSYEGMRLGLLATDLFDDVKLLAKADNTLQVILLYKEGLYVGDSKIQVANAIHTLNPLTVTYSTDSAQKHYQPINASTGQEVTYTWYDAKRRRFNFNVTYFLGYEEEVENYGYEDEIKASVNNTYDKVYNKLGKDLIIKDFYSITKDVKGVVDVSISIDEVSKDEDGYDTVIATYDNIDVTMDLIEMFNVNDIKLILGD